MMRHRNDGLRKVCGCARRTWAKCEHPWHFNFKWAGEVYRFSLERVVGKIAKDAAGKWTRDRATLGVRIMNKTDAEKERDRLRTAIRDGVLTSDRPVLSTLTVTQLFDTYGTRYLQLERPTTAAVDRARLTTIARTSLTRPSGDVRAFGDWFVIDVTTDTIEQFRAARRPSGLVATNRSLAALRACFNWAIRVGYLERTPFKRGTETVIKLSRELPRRRRLEAGEADRLLQACGPTLRPVVEAALETGCRKGELLSLQWHQVRLTPPKRELVLPAQKTKTKRDRRIPISSRLQAILEMRQKGPDDKDHPPTDYVFGNEIGQRVKTFKRAWESALLRAHGHRPMYLKGTAKLTPESRVALRAINLHFHDLRREAGSRWLDGGVPLQTVRDWLGHANISQTSTYLESTFQGQHEAMRQFEERRAAALQPLATESGTGAQTATSSETMPHATTQKNTESYH